MDLKVLIKDIKNIKEVKAELIFAPFLEDKERERLIDVVSDLRADGKRVVCALSGSEKPSNLCTHKLFLSNEQWVVSEIA